MTEKPAAPALGVRGSSTRDKILSTARALFYQEGIRAVGVDTIVERSGVAKTSLYRWFPTKDDLIARFLEQEDTEFWAHWDSVATRFQGRPLDAFGAHMKWIGDYIAGPRFRGCPFLNATAEFPDAAHPARAVCRANKAELRRRLAELAKGAGVVESDALADQLVLLLDGAFANSQVLGKRGPAQMLGRAATALIEAALAVSRRTARRGA